MSNKTIVLAHGLFGFGELFPGFLSKVQIVHYFNGLKSHLEGQGHTVFEPQVNPIGSIADRGNRLAEAILKLTKDGDRVHVIAHSMGGLDARHAITNRKDVVQRIATLVTIGTPHLGSPVADAIVNPSSPLSTHIPAFLREKLEANAGALHDLTTDFCGKFDEATPDIGTVRYFNVAGDASLGGQELFLLELAAKIGKLTGKINDGVVTRDSALRKGHQHLNDWPVDHLGEIGWSSALLTSSSFMTAHLARYDAIVAML